MISMSGYITKPGAALDRMCNTKHPSNKLRGSQREYDEHWGHEVALRYPSGPSWPLRLGRRIEPASTSVISPIQHQSRQLLGHLPFKRIRIIRNETVAG